MESRPSSDGYLRGVRRGQVCEVGWEVGEVRSKCREQPLPLHS